MTNSIEITIGNNRYVLKSEESEEHLREVTEMVRRKVDTIRKKSSTYSIQKAAILAAFDLASDLIKAKRKSGDYRSKILAKAHSLLERVEHELESSHP
jgi:cell division protein ZapA (FtsZ GTPase activity inhibitor)